MRYDHVFIEIYMQKMRQKWEKKTYFSEKLSIFSVENMKIFKKFPKMPLNHTIRFPE